jgi:hypothetical protein
VGVRVPTPGHASFVGVLILLFGALDLLLAGATTLSPSLQRDNGLCIRMLTMIVFVLLGFALGAFLSFPAFALMAIACSITYSLCTFDGTVIGYVANLVGAVVAAQLGFFSTVLTMILRRRFQLSIRNDQ